MRTWIVAAVLLAAGLAGCADESPKPVDDDEDKFEDIDVGKDEGAIRGIVLDPSITPIAGARVALKDQDKEATTNADGAFVFSRLDPGSYFVEVSKIGYTTTQTSVNVVAGEDTPPIVKVQLSPDPSSVPFTQSFVFEGFIQCSFTAGVRDVRGLGANACGVVEIAAGIEFGEELVEHETARIPDYAQTEMVWEGTQPLGDALSLMYSWDCGDTFLCDHDATGTSPLTLQANQTVLKTAIESEGVLFVRVFGTASDTVPSPIMLGATIEQPFTHYTNAFYGFTPDEAWRFIEDGAHPAPA